MSLTKGIYFTLGFFLLIALGQSVQAGSRGVRMLEDSIGMEKRNGKTFVLYRVEPKETLYGIANKYNTSVAELVQYNPQTEAGLKVGDVLAIPYKASHSGLRYHVVEKSETLFSISRLYNISVEELKSWNSLSDNAINVGDRLHVSPPRSEATAQEVVRPAQQQTESVNYAGKIVHSVKEKETLYSLARMYDTSVDKIREWNKLSTNDLHVGQKLIVGTTNALPDNKRVMRSGNSGTDNRRRDYAYNSDPMAISQIGDPTQEDLQGAAPELDGGMVRKITELGMAEGITDSLNTKKYLALHRTAPIGTIMQVHNEMNNLSVFVRIVGKLPETAENDKVIIKISEKAFHKLGAYGQKFPVRLSYIP